VSVSPILQSFGFGGKYENVSASVTEYVAFVVGDTSSLTPTEIADYTSRLAATLSESSPTPVAPRTIKVVLTESINVSDKVASSDEIRVDKSGSGR
jgi:hypothetical protein